MEYSGADPHRVQEDHERELQARRARYIAFGSLGAVALIVLLIVVTSGSGSGSSASRVTHKPGSGKGNTSAVSRTSKQGTASVPILSYNVINVPPTGSSAPAGMYVPVDEFTAQMNALKSDGWHAVTLTQLQAYWTKGTSLGAGKPIVITFDTGYASQYTNALPVLKRLGWVGVENLRANGLSSSDGGLADDQVRGLVSAGWELGTDGSSRPDLTALDASGLTDETSAARQTLSSRYGVAVNWFAYPSGDYNPTVTAAVRAAGFTGATTLVAGWASPQGDRLRLPRLQVVSGTSPSQLLSQIASAQQATSTPDTSRGP
jgi:peptidoglycan/xylan/chitin deacetylase (PgdA/CDA1 family)